jgi:hypothetical protein
MPKKSVIILIYYHQEILGLSKTECNLRLDNLKTPKPVKYCGVPPKSQNI